jgi:hypothetical protein
MEREREKEMVGGASGMDGWVRRGGVGFAAPRPSPLAFTPNYIPRRRANWASLVIASHSSRMTSLNLLLCGWKERERWF